MDLLFKYYCDVSPAFMALYVFMIDSRLKLYRIIGLAGAPDPSLITTAGSENMNAVTFILGSIAKLKFSPIHIFLLTMIL